MKLLFSILTAFIVLSCSGSGESDGVYICVSEGAYAYHHNADCGGLNRCTHQVRKVSLEEAQNEYGRQACGLE
ncbi:hypothetical protein N9355_01360 [Crocinitomicaceae bacterium]|nr:hypothetical protein [Crocinitomicaceae bacterium]